MFSTITILASTLAFNLIATPAQTEAKPQDKPGNGLFGLGIDLGGKVDVDLGDCLGVDIVVGAKCGVLAGVEAALECDPLSVEAACIAELGADCGIQAFAACTAEMTAHCQAEVQAGGALFCDGNFIGADTCLGDIDVDVDIDTEDCVDVDLGEDVDLNIDLNASVCLDLELGLNAKCYIKAGAQCHAACGPIAVEAACEGEFDGSNDELHAFAACQAGLIAQCHANCDADGSLFCDGTIYAGAELCLDVGLGIGIGF